jgi:excisionase family DNA binding protein
MSSENNDDLLDFLDASRFLNVSPSTLKQKYIEWKIPAYQVGRHIRFSRIELWKWLHTNRKGANA